MDRTCPRSVVLGSGSRYRAQVLGRAGYEVEIDPPEIDERAHDSLFHTEGPDALALELATLKAQAVAQRHPGAIVVAGDQVGSLGSGPSLRMLTKTPDVESSLQQLMAMSGRAHRLHNALMVMVGPNGPSATGIEVVEVTMRPFDRVEALAYIERFKPFDTAGSYRLEDEAEMDAGSALVQSVLPADPSAVMGIPLGLLEKLLDELGSGAPRG